MHPTLLHLGYDSFFAEQAERLGAEYAPARVVGQHRRQWDVTHESGTERAVLAGRLFAQDHVTQLDDAQPTVGDWVLLERAQKTSAAVIAHVLERRTSLCRTSMARRGERQTLVANIDYVAIVAAFAGDGATDHAARRSLHPRRIERYVAAVRQGGAEPIILLNKSDLTLDPDTTAQELSVRLGKCQVLPVCTTLSDGLGALLALLQPGQTIGFVGLSGVGKSSIVNRLMGNDVQPVAAERKDSRGRHTTTHRQLFVTPQHHLVIDTPGMREFALSDSEEGDLAAFEDIVGLAAECQFRDCTHATEPGCRVRRAVSEGILQKDRLLNFQALSKQAAEPSRARRQLTRRRQKYPQRRDRNFDED